MTKHQLQQILVILRQQAQRNPYFTFVYNWGIVNQTSYEVPTASQIMQCINGARFPPIGKN